MNNTLYGEQLYLVSDHYGITTLRDDIIWLDYSCSGIGLNYSGTRITFEFVSTIASADYAWIEIHLYADDILKRSVHLIDREKTTVSLETSGVTWIAVFKRTEKKYNPVGISCIEYNGQLLPCQPSNRKRILFIGDSISCGYGVERFSLLHRFSTKFENGLKAYPFLLSRMLNFDYDIIAYSGIGVWRSHKNFTYGVILSKYKEETAHLPVMTPPHLIIVNIGTNDSGRIRTAEDKYAFENAYRQLISCLHRQHPGATILCAIGPMKCVVKDHIKKICLEYARNDGLDIHFVKLTRRLWDGIGIGKHPTSVTQRANARQLYRYYKKNCAEDVEE